MPIIQLLSRIPVWGWMLFSFAVWLISFQAFLLARAPLTSDAIAYLVSSKDLVNFLQQGIWPLWHFGYGHGVPFDFFTQRMGAFNPLYTAMALLDATRAFNFLTTYTLILSIYYFLGMTGFYFLVNKIYNDRRVAFCGFILLLFSSLGTRIFDSFLCLVSVPLIWFFYFLASFVIAPRKLWFTGCVLTAMILCGTYVPFYFLMTLIIVTFCYTLVFRKDTCRQSGHIFGFVRANLVYCLLLLLAFIITLIPGASLYFNSFGNISLPLRHGAPAGSPGLAAAANHIFKVDPGYLKWGAFEELIFSSFFTSVPRFTFEVVFFPLFSISLILWGTFCRVNKRLVFYLCAALLFLCIGSPRTPVYALFAESFFFFKYFRNLHFFLWFSVLPLFVLIFSDFFYQLLRREETLASWTNSTLCLLNLAIHSILALFLLVRGDWGILSALTVAASCLFIWKLITGRSSQITNGVSSPAVRQESWLRSAGPSQAGRLAEWAVCGALCLLVLPQAFNTFFHLGLKNRSPKPYLAAHGGYQITLPEANDPAEPAKAPARIASDYYATKGWSELAGNVSGKAITQYLQNPLIFYDRVKAVPKDRYGFKRMEIAFLHDENLAFIPMGVKCDRFSNHLPPAPHPLRNNTAGGNCVAIKKQNPNFIIFKTSLPAEKFLVFNDADHSQWHAFINGKESPLVNANIAFKGLWIPAGQSFVEFRFSTPSWYGLNVFIWLIFHSLFIGICLVLVKERRKGAL